MTSLTRYLFTFSVLLLSLCNLQGQHWKNLVTNGSLESVENKIPKWKFPQRGEERNHPDIYDGGANPYGVETQPTRGKSFVGLVARDDGTYEYMVQKLGQRLFVGKRFRVVVVLCRSGNMSSYTPTSENKPMDFSHAISLRITLGDTIHEIEDIQNTEWQSFELTFSPKAPVKSITLAAFHNSDSPSFYNGNLMIDAVIINELP